ncbi:MAG: ATP-binding cassette domain-containing protein, partial [Staphylococcus equorum]|nr:ATP-binding cassette domain-containing protein [Staphylococcus equorum]
EKKEVVRGLSLRVRKGEILGIAAIDGNGQRELIDSITGLGVSEAGHIFIKGEETSENNPTQDRRDRGLVHIPEDRSTFGAMMDQSIRDNIIANRFDKDAFNKGISLDRQKIEDEVDQLIEKYQIKTDSPLTPVGMLSGGNIQKVVAARELSVPMSVLIADQPTRGIDVGTAAFIHDTIVNLRDQGAGILLSSADLNEVLELSDSLIVMYDGEITGYFEDSTMLEEEELGLYMLGIKRMEKEVIEREMYD